MTGFAKEGPTLAIHCRKYQYFQFVIFLKIDLDSFSAEAESLKVI
jgi:hypothetical protein